MSATQNYELTYILGETATEEQNTAKVTELKEVIAKMGGAVEKEEIWGRRELAYQIGKSRSGFYTTFWFSLPVDQVNPLERLLRFDESIIRSLVTKAYIHATPGSLYPVVEEEKTARRPRRGEKEETATAEEELRMHAGDKPKKAKATEATEEVEEISEEDRLKKLDESLDQLLKEE